MEKLSRWTKDTLKSKVIPPYVITWKAGTSKPFISLTFDDGPCPKKTARILERLRKAGARATFFVIGAKAAQDLSLLADIAAEGHELGCHGYNHRRPQEQPSRALMRQELLRTNELIEKVTFRPVKLFRPPCGELSLALLYEIHRAFLRPVLWSKDTFDALGATPQNPRGLFDVTSGDIVLMHDRYAAPWLEVVLEQMERLELRSLPVSRLLEDQVFTVRGPAPNPAAF